MTPQEEAEMDLYRSRMNRAEEDLRHAQSVISVKDDQLATLNRQATVDAAEVLALRAQLKKLTEPAVV